MNEPDLGSWIGRQQAACDVVSHRQIATLAAILDSNAHGTLAQCGHWTLAPAIARAEDIGADGHERLGRFLPPVGQARRMWAGSAIRFHRPISAGMEVQRQSTVHAVRRTVGASGPLVFVEIDHAYRSAGEPLVSELQTIVYVSGQPAGGRADTGSGAADNWPMQRGVTPDAVMLFRYSAATFNGHRIHYDRPYAHSEGYGGLVVHGPLVATLLADLVARHHGADALGDFSFRAASPAIAGETIRLVGQTEADHVALRAEMADGRLVATAWGLLRR